MPVREVGPAAAVRYNFGMSDCVGLLVEAGLVMLSDSRTNAGFDIKRDELPIPNW
jgi:hypothetical protein